MNVGGWLARTWESYAHNAGSVREYRTQFRGSKAAWLWSAYLGLVLLLAFPAYIGAYREGEVSLAVAQGQLRAFYVFVLGVLEIAVALVAPALVCSSILGDKLRKMTDLVFSAPVEPRYYLVGKLISGARIVAMMIVLTLPVLAACVVIGGATWDQVVIASVALFCRGLLYLAIALPIGLLSEKIGGAVFTSYAAIAAVLLLLSIVGGNAAAMSSAFGPSTGPVELPFIVLVVPILASEFANSITRFGGLTVPNWALLVLATLLAVWFTTLCAGSIMVRYRSPLLWRARAAGLFLAFLFAWALSGVGGFLGGMGITPWHALVASLFPLLLTVPILVSSIATWSAIDDRKYRPSGWFNVPEAFRFSPGGALPYLYMIGVAMLGGALVTRLTNPLPTGPGRMMSGTTTLASVTPLALDWGLLYPLWMFGALTLFWSFAFVASSFAKRGLKAARAGYIAVLLIGVLIPLQVGVMIDSAIASRFWNSSGVSGEGPWVLLAYPLSGFVWKEWWQILIATCSVWTFAVILTAIGIFGQRKRRTIPKPL